MMRIVPALLLLPLLPAQGTSTKTVTAEEADSHIAKRVELALPSLAESMKIGGKVRLHITISPLGDVSSVNAISGHPFLILPAVEAAKRWKYKPYVESGKPVPVETDVELDFPYGLTEKEDAARTQFFPVEDECRSLLKAGDYVDAERKCRDAVEISNDLPKALILERSGARSFLANVIFLQCRYKEAISLYEKALALDKGYLMPDEADLIRTH